MHAQNAKVHGFGEKIALHLNPGEASEGSTVYLNQSLACRVAGLLMRAVIAHQQGADVASVELAPSSDPVDVSGEMGHLLGQLLSTEARAEQVGAVLTGACFMMKRRSLAKGGDRYDMEGGDKSQAGVARTIARILTAPDSWNNGK